MKLTKNEKVLLELIIEAWQQEGCPNVYEECWGRDKRDPNDNVIQADYEVGKELLSKAVKGLEQKLEIKIYL